VIPRQEQLPALSGFHQGNPRAYPFLQDQGEPGTAGLGTQDQDRRFTGQILAIPDYVLFSTDNHAEIDRQGSQEAKDAEDDDDLKKSLKDTPKARLWIPPPPTDTSYPPAAPYPPHSYTIVILFRRDYPSLLCYLYLRKKTIYLRMKYFLDFGGLCSILYTGDKAQ
jgi:hypothetical protein